MENNNKIEFNTKPMTCTDGLLLLFIGLKLSHIIDWSWVWVLAPLWISFIYVVGLSVVITILKRKK